MPTPQQETAYEITWLIRRLFRSMAAAADRYLEDAELSAAERAVMEFLYPDAQLTVPAIAAKYDVSRQHVQVTVNALLQRGLVRSTTNPRHKRSPLIRLSALGRDCFHEIRQNETQVIERVFRGVPDASLDITRATLTTLLGNLK